MTNEVTVEFSVERVKNVPRIGQRKLLRVNGCPENLWCKKVSVRMERVWDEATDFETMRTMFEGEATYGPWKHTA